MMTRKFDLLLFCIFLLAGFSTTVSANELDRGALQKNKINRITVVMEERTLHAFHQSLDSDETDEGFFADSVSGKKRNNEERDKQAAPILKRIPNYDYVGSTINTLRSILPGSVFSSNVRIKLLDSYPELKTGEPVIEIDYMFDKNFAALNIMAGVEYKQSSGSDTYKKIFLSRFKAWPETVKPGIDDNIEYWQNNPEFLKSQLSRGIAEIASLIHDNFDAELPKRKKWTTATLQTPYNSHKQVEIVSEENGRVFMAKNKGQGEPIHAIVDAALLGKRRERQQGGSFFDGFRSKNEDEEDDE